MMSTTSTVETPGGAPQQPLPQDTARRMPRGIDIVFTDAAPARLPAQERPCPQASGAARSVHRLIARNSGEYLFVGLRGGNGVPCAAPSGREAADVPLTPGDISFYDACHPPTLDFPERFRAKVFLVPRDLLGLDDFAVHRLATAPVTRTSRLGTLLSPFLSDLADTATASRPPIADMLAWNAVNLLATLATEQLGADTAARPAAEPPLLPRIRDFIELHLTDAHLSPEMIAGAHHISVRYLHKLFQDGGTTVGRWIQRRRLEECRRDLVLRARGNQTIAAVAGRWGFMSATHFSRVFRAAYGMSPSAWRDTAGRGPRHGHG